MTTSMTTTKRQLTEVWEYSQYRASLRRNGVAFALVTRDGKNSLNPKEQTILLAALNRPNDQAERPAVRVQRMVRPDPRTFSHFPPDSKCPICDTNDDGTTVLVEISGTAKDGIAQAKPMHLACAISKQWDESMGIALTWPNAVGE